MLLTKGISTGATSKYQCSTILLAMMIYRYSSQLHSIPSFLSNSQDFDLHYKNQYTSHLYLLRVIYRNLITPFNSLNILSPGSPSTTNLSSFLMSHKLSIQHPGLSVHRNLHSQGSCPPPI